MNTRKSRGLFAFVAVPVTAAGLIAGALGFADVAYASVTPGVDAQKSGMMLSKEYIAEQKGGHGASAQPIDLQMRQEGAQPGSPSHQEANELKGDIKAEEVKSIALNTVESMANVQTPQPKSHAYTLKNPIHKHLGMMKAGFSQTAR
jgi:hypothetical protein